MKQLSHVDSSGKARMVDVSVKPFQFRTARATGLINLSADTLLMIKKNEIKKGDVLSVSKIAGIQAAKMTQHLIPLCHPLNLSHIEIEFQITPKGIRANSEVSCIGPTGVEMEALTAVSSSLLTIYDMCKAVDKTMKIGDIELLQKTKKNLPSKK